MRKVIISIVMVLCIIIPQAAFADSMDVSIKGGKDVKVGDTFNLTVSYSADNIDWIDGQLKYDTSVLSYVSGGASSGDGGVVSLKSASDNGRTVDFEITFKAVGSGSSNVSVETEEAYDLDGNLLELSQTSKTISVEGEIQKEDVSEDDEEDDEDIAEDEDEGDEPETKPEESSMKMDKMQFYLICGAAVTVFLIIILGCIAARRKRKNRR